MRPRTPGRLATSRRTPASLLADWPGGLPERVAAVPFLETGPGWLDEHLPRARACLVTPDSLSMVFDALTAGVPCGVFDLERAGRGTRAAAAVERLLGEGRVGRASDLAERRELPVQPPLAEAGRVAQVIVDRWFP